jgi:hypothetical protein
MAGEISAATTKPRYEVRYYADRDAETLIGGEWHDNYVLARQAADSSFVNGGVEFAGVLDHARGFWPYRIVTR